MSDLDPEHQQLAVDSRRSPQWGFLAHPSDKVADLAVDPRVAPFPPLRSAELYSPLQNKFIATGDMLTPRADAAMVTLSNGTVLITGGDGGATAPALSEAEIYTPPSMPAVKIVSPVNYSDALLGSPRIIYAEIGPKVSWVNVYVDGKHLRSLPPFQFVWTPTTTGAHHIRVKAYDCYNKRIGKDAITVDVRP